jgi:CBS-domain-containing membrane protein
MMKTALKPILTRTAADLMSGDVVMIPCEMSLRTAARCLARARISGAPVVDAAGRCVGVLSATDFISWAGAPGAGGERAVRRRAAETPCSCSDWQLLDVEALPEDSVGRFMTPDVVTVGPGATVGELARDMINARVHRVIVVDRDRRPVGVVSSMDIVAAVAAEAAAAGE